MTALPSGRPVVFYTPHADDETLFMGRAIAHHALAGREVHIVLGSAPASTYVRQQINGETTSPFWAGYHVPDVEGHDGLTRDESGTARMAELTGAAGCLGVWPQFVHLPDVTASITYDYARDLIASYAAALPGTGHYTMWWGDNHAEHAAFGQALRDLRAAQPTTYSDARWMVKPEQASAASAAVYAVPASQAATVTRMTQRATLSYRSWAPQQGLFALGYHSVGSSYFDDVERGDPNWMVRP